MNGLGSNQTQVAAQCADAAQDLFPDNQQPVIIRKQLRRDCLANVFRLTSDEALGIELVIIDSGEADGIRTAFRDYDSVGVFDESFALWRYHSGRIAWSEDSAHAKRYRRMLQELRTQRGSHTGAEALKLIESLAVSVG